MQFIVPAFRSFKLVKKSYKPGALSLPGSPAITLAAAVALYKVSPYILHASASADGQDHAIPEEGVVPNEGMLGVAFVGIDKKKCLLKDDQDRFFTISMQNYIAILQHTQNFSLVTTPLQWSLDETGEEWLLPSTYLACPENRKNVVSLGEMIPNVVYEDVVEGSFYVKRTLNKEYYYLWYSRSCTEGAFLPLLNAIIHKDGTLHPRASLPPEMSGAFQAHDVEWQDYTAIRPDRILAVNTPVYDYCLRLKKIASQHMTVFGMKELSTTPYLSGIGVDNIPDLFAMFSLASRVPAESGLDPLPCTAKAREAKNGEQLPASREELMRNAVWLEKFKVSVSMPILVGHTAEEQDLRISITATVEPVQGYKVRYTRKRDTGLFMDPEDTPLTEFFISARRAKNLGELLTVALTQNAELPSDWRVFLVQEA